MTDDMMNLRALLEKSLDADPLREMIGFAAEWQMEMEVVSATGAAYVEKSPLQMASAMAIATGTNRRVPGPLSYASRS